MIYKMMNCEDYKEKNVSFIVGLKEAMKFVADVYDNECETEGFFYEYDDEEIEEILNDNEFFVVSRNYYGENKFIEYFIEPLLHDGEQFYLESDYVFIEDDLVDVVDIDKISADEIFTLEIEEDEDSDDEDYTCDYYYAGFKDGYSQAICEVIDLLYDKLKVE